jgi:diaminopimelate epimerase
MRFTKMQGAGNDYIYVDCFQETPPDDLAETARRISDRHFGVGGDGLVLICPSQVADAQMRMFNADGSESEMCGNAIRCVAKYVYEHGIARKGTMQIETGAGVLSLELFEEDGVVECVRVDMGCPILDPQKIPTTWTGGEVVVRPNDVDGREFRVTCVSMGNPHCVSYVEELSDELVLGFGPKIELDPHFPNKVNAEFVQVISPREIRMRVWERGSGETLACGTGASAVCVAGVISGRTEREITAHLRGGDLQLHWAENNHLYMTGPAVEVFSGEWRNGK